MEISPEFAKYYLAYTGNKLFVNDKQILQITEDNHRDVATYIKWIRGQKIKIRIDEDLEEERLIKEIGIADLRKIGFDIVWKPIEKGKGWYKGQRTKWMIVKKGQGLSLDRTSYHKSEGSVLEYDALKREIRGKGKQFCSVNGRYVTHTGWIPIREKRVQKVKLSAIEYAQRQMKQWVGEEVQHNIEEITVNEVVAMITDERQIICIPKEKDMQSIALVSKTAKGKTTSTSSMASQLFEIFTDSVVMFDPLGIFKSWMLPNYFFEPDLKHFGIVGQGMPAVVVNIASDNVELLYHKGVEFIYPIEWNNFIKPEGYKFFTDKINDLDLGGKESYLEELYEDFKNLTDAKDIEFFMKTRFGEDDKGIQMMIRKWKPKFSSILRHKFTSQFYENNPIAGTNWKLIRKDGSEFESNPLIVCAEANIPVVVAMDGAKPIPCFKNIFAYHVNNFIEHQKSTPKQKRKRIWLIFDELHEFYERGQKKGLSEEIQHLFFREKRNYNMGVIVNTQSYADLHKIVRKNITHLLCGQILTEEERTLIKKDYSLSTTQKEQLGNLGKLEFMLMTKEKVIVYEPDGERVTLPNGGVFVGKIFPSTAQHIIPK